MTRLEEIEERLNRSTPGPWRVDIAADAKNHDVYAGTYKIAEVLNYYRLPQHYYNKQRNSVDAQLIAHAPDDVRYLLDTVAKLEAALSVSWDAISQSRGQWIHSVNAQRCLNALTAIEAALKGDGK